MKLGATLSMTGIRRKGASVAHAWQEILAAADAAGAQALYDPDNPNTWTLREDGGDVFYEQVSDGLGNEPALVQTEAARQPHQAVTSTGRRVFARVGGSARRMAANPFTALIEQPNTTIALVRDVDGTGSDTQRFLSNLGDSGDWQVIDTPSRDAFRLHAGSAVSEDIPDTNRFHIIQGNYNGASSEMYLDGTLIRQANVGDNDLANAGIMADDGFGSALEETGRVGVVVYFRDMKTANDTSDLTQAISDAYPIGEGD